MLYLSHLGVPMKEPQNSIKQKKSFRSWSLFLLWLVLCLSAQLFNLTKGKNDRVNQMLAPINATSDGSEDTIAEKKSQPKEHKIQKLIIRIKHLMDQPALTIKEEDELENLTKILLRHYEPIFQRHASRQFAKAGVDPEEFPGLLEELIDISRLVLMEKINGWDPKTDFHTDFSTRLSQDLAKSFQMAIQQQIEVISVPVEQMGFNQEPHGTRTEDRLYLEQLLQPGSILPEALRDTLRLHLQGFTYREIGAMSDPPVSATMVGNRLSEAFRRMRETEEEKEGVTTTTPISDSIERNQWPEIRTERSTTTVRQRMTLQTPDFPWATRFSSYKKRIGPWQEEAVLETPSRENISVQICSDNQHVIVASSEEVAIWNLSRKEMAQSLYRIDSDRVRVHRDWQRTRLLFSTSENQEYLTVASKVEKVIFVWKKNDKNEYDLFKTIQLANEAISLAISPDGKWIVWGDKHGDLEWRVLMDDFELRTPLGFPVRYFSFSKDSRILAVASPDKVVILDMDSVREKLGPSRVWQAQAADIIGIQWHSKRRELLVSVPDYFHFFSVVSTLDASRPMGGNAHRSRIIAKGGEYSVDIMDFASDRRWCAEGMSHVLRLYDFRSRQKYVSRNPGLDYKLLSFAFSPDGTVFVTAFENGKVILWRLQESVKATSGELEQEL